MGAFFIRFVGHKRVIAPSRAKEPAEKHRKTRECPEQHHAGAEAQPLLSASCGTTEVVPCYKTWAIWSSSAASKAHRLLTGICGTNKVVPFQNLTFTTSSQMSKCNCHPAKRGVSQATGILPAPIS
jgi:hypothetical protein